MDGVTRRKFLQMMGGLGALGVAPAGLATPAAVAAEGAQAPASFQYLNDREAAFLRAAVDHLIPADERWPSAAEAGVVNYIDRQLAGAYGHGHRLYLQGPWPAGTPQQGYQLRLTPRELYSLGIAAVEARLQEDGAAFAELGAQAQVRVLEQLEQGELELEPLPAPVFFETLLANTIEGYFADPAYGGNRDMAGWRMVGFPGAYSQYVKEIERHGVPFTRPPMSMMQSARRPHG
ncbi:gluconate 2-dehydrogenase subunit 3 family protein [Ectothiorhodospiraceae bacterium 2226]|nr:gluconate 2-dehydrogenase subunit 3 family protein [Ectothiorhodospiraceae bacterium 2226]